MNRSKTPPQHMSSLEGLHRARATLRSSLYSMYVGERLGVRIQVHTVQKFLELAGRSCNAPT